MRWAGAGQGGGAACQAGAEAAPDRRNIAYDFYSIPDHNRYSEIYSELLFRQ
jgi:hypothetical protein